MYMYKSSYGTKELKSLHQSQGLPKLIAISQRFCQPLLTLEAGCVQEIIMAKIGYSVRGLVAKVKDTVANS